MLSEPAVIHMNRPLPPRSSSSSLWCRRGRKMSRIPRRVCIHPSSSLFGSVWFLHLLLLLSARWPRLFLCEGRRFFFFQKLRHKEDDNHSGVSHPFVLFHLQRLTCFLSHLVSLSCQKSECLNQKRLWSDIKKKNIPDSLSSRMFLK